MINILERTLERVTWVFRGLSGKHTHDLLGGAPAQFGERCVGREGYMRGNDYIRTSDQFSRRIWLAFHHVQGRCGEVPGGVGHRLRPARYRPCG